jgi:SAM-dependent methyltransferase
MISALTRNRRKNRILLPALDNLKIDIGCGNEKANAKFHGLEGYIGIDIVDYGQAILWDIEKGLPLPDNSCINIFCSHVVEHVEDLIGLMNEFWRVLKPEGELYIVCPHKDNENAYLPHHIRRFDKKTFEAFDYSWSPKREWNVDYDVLPWKIKELIVNSKKDIHFWALPNKEGI